MAASPNAQEYRCTVPDSHPYARYYPDLRLMTWHPAGALTDEWLDRGIEYIEWREEIEGVPFNRYVDMSGYTRIEVSLDHIVRVARRRRLSYCGAPVRTALFAVRLISLQIASMYQELMEGSGIEVCTCATRTAAAEWIGAPE